jgi:hypothetical protein
MSENQRKTFPPLFLNIRKENLVFIAIPSSKTWAQPHGKLQ